MSQLWSNGLLRRATLDAMLIGALCGAVGVHVVLRRLPFFAASLAHARAVIAAFAAELAKGVHILDGDMLDRPHLLRAERTLARAEAAGSMISRISNR